MTEAMVERVARALCKEDGHDPDYRGLGGSSDDEPAWTYYKFQAKAAIEAMREPSPKMVLAGNEAMPDGIVYSLEPGEGIDDYDSRPAWNSMIDAALKE